MPTFKIGLDDGRSLQIEADDQEAALAGAQHFMEGEKPSGVGAGLAHGVSGLASDVSSTLGLGGIKSDGLDTFAAKTAPDNYKAAPLIREGGHFYNPSDWNPSNIPQALAEQAPGLASDVAAGATGAKIGKTLGGVRGAAIGGAVGGLGSMFLRTFGPGAHENAKARTGDENAPVTGADMAREGVKQAITAPINAVGINRIIPGLGAKVAGVGLEGAGNALKKYIATVGTEFATGGARDAVSQATTNIGQDHGATFDPNKTAEASVTSGAGGGLLVAPRLAGDLTSASKFRKFGGDNSEAATALANRQIEAADGKNLIGPLGGTKNAADAVNAAHAAVHTELADASKSENLSTDNANTLKRINSGGTVSKGALDALATEASPDTAHLARQAVLSKQLKDMGEITDKKFTGGISGMMEDKLRALYNPTAAVASMGAAAMGLPAMIGLSPHIVAGTYGAYAGARALDKLTGARSPAQGFTDKFADANVPVRAPEAVPPVPAPVSTSVPQVTPPQNTALWGNPAEPVPNLRATLNANAKVDEGMAKMAKQAAAAKRQAMISDTMPALAQLAASRPPEPAPEVSQIEQQTLQQKAMQRFAKAEKAYRPPVEEAAPAAPEINPNALPTAITRPAKNITRGFKNSARAQEVFNIATRKAEGTAQAEGLAADSHVINEQGGLRRLSNPEFTKRGSQLLSAANVMRRLTAQPEEEVSDVPDGPASPQIAQAMQTVASHAPPAPAPAAPAPAAPAAPTAPSAPPTTMASILSKLGPKGNAPATPQGGLPPQAPMIAKISKKLNGSVNETPHPEEDQPYTPIPPEGLYRKSMSDEQMVQHEFANYKPSKREAYGSKATSNRENNREDLQAIAADNTPEDAALANALYHQLDHIKTPAHATKAIAHYTAHMSPQAAHAVHVKFTREVIHHRWKEKK